MGQGFLSKYILTEIADYIRGRKGSTAEIKPISMRSELDSIPTYEQGKQAEYDRFWDAYQRKGTRRNYKYAFGGEQGWDDELFKPKYDIILTAGHTGQNAFWYCEVSNIAEALEKQGVRLDTTLCGNAEYMFQGSVTTRIPELNFSHAADYSSTTGLGYTFSGSAVKTIDKLIVSEQLKYIGTFNGCRNLENITFEGTIGNNISLASSPLLTNASVQSIIDHLKDLTGQTAQTLTFHADVGANLSDAQKATVTAKNWTLVY